MQNGHSVEAESEVSVVNKKNEDEKGFLFVFVNF